MRLYKLTNANHCHHGFQYKEGLNVDTISFNPTGSCQPGGLYYFNEVQLLGWTNYVNSPEYIWDVEIPADAQVYHERGKSKASALILSNCRKFSMVTQECIDWEDEKICLAAVSQNGGALQYVKDQTPELCMAAVQNTGWALWLVKEQTPEICLAAVQQDGNALQFVKEQTPEICLAAVRQNGWALRYVKEDTIRQQLIKENTMGQ